MLQRVNELGLGDIVEKLDTGERLAFEDGVRLFDCPDLLAIGWLANRQREKRHEAGLTTTSISASKLRTCASRAVSSARSRV